MAALAELYSLNSPGTTGEPGRNMRDAGLGVGWIWMNMLRCGCRLDRKTKACPAEPSFLLPKADAVRNDLPCRDSGNSSGRTAEKDCSN